MCRKMKLDHLLMPHTRIGSKWIKDLNVRPETIKILEENIVKSWPFLVAVFYLIYFLRQGKQTKKLVNGTTINQKVFAQQGNHQQNKNITYWMGEHICLITSDKGLISKIYKELIKLNTPPQKKNPVKKWAKDSNRHFFKEDIHMAYRQMKRCSVSLIMREMQINTRMRYLLTPVRMVVVSKSTHKCNEEVEKGTLLHCWECSLV